MSEQFSEADWQAVTLLEQEDQSPGARTNKRWGSFPQRAEPERVFFFPDLHFPYEDKLFLAYLIGACKKLNPTTIVIIGDLLDCYSVSNFDKDPSRKESMNDERNAAVKFLRELRRLFPDTEIIFIEGNHEERIMRNIKRYLPGLYDLPELSVASLLKLDELNIKHFRSKGFVRWGLRVKHGKSVAKWSSNAEMLKHRMSGISGHVHRKQEASFTDGEGHTTIWRAIGHGCDMSFVDYVEGPNWVQAGGQLIHHPDGSQEWLYLEG